MNKASSQAKNLEPIHRKPGKEVGILECGNERAVEAKTLSLYLGVTTMLKSRAYTGPSGIH